MDLTHTGYFSFQQLLSGLAVKIFTISSRKRESKRRLNPKHTTSDNPSPTPNHYPHSQRSTVWTNPGELWIMRRHERSDPLHYVLEITHHFTVRGKRTCMIDREVTSVQFEPRQFFGNFFALGDLEARWRTCRFILCLTRDILTGKWKVWSCGLFGTCSNNFMLSSYTCVVAIPFSSPREDIFCSALEWFTYRPPAFSSISSSDCVEIP